MISALPLLSLYEREAPNMSRAASLKRGEKRISVFSEYFPFIFKQDN